MFKLKKKINNSAAVVKWSQSQTYSACVIENGTRLRNLYELLPMNLHCLFKLNNICFCCLSCRCPSLVCVYFFFLTKVLRLFLMSNPFKCTVYHIYEMYWYQKEADDFVFKQRPQDKGQCFSPHRWWSTYKECSG